MSEEVIDLCSDEDKDKKKVLEVVAPRCRAYAVPGPTASHKKRSMEGFLTTTQVDEMLKQVFPKNSQDTLFTYIPGAHKSTLLNRLDAPKRPTNWVFCHHGKGYFGLLLGMANEFAFLDAKKGEMSLMLKQELNHQGFTEAVVRNVPGQTGQTVQRGPDFSGCGVYVIRYGELVKNWVKIPKRMETTDVTHEDIARIHQQVYCLELRKMCKSRTTR